MYTLLTPEAEENAEQGTEAERRATADLLSSAAKKAKKKCFAEKDKLASVFFLANPSNKAKREKKTNINVPSAPPLLHAPRLEGGLINAQKEAHTPARLEKL